MSRADQVADAIEAILNGGGRDLPQGNRREVLAEVLGAALDRYELARLYCVATETLGQSPIPEHPAAWVQHSPARWTPETVRRARGVVKAVLMGHQERK